MKTKIFSILTITLLLFSCNNNKETKSGLIQKEFQTEINGKKTNLYILKNKNGLEACITNFGAKLVSMMVPDKDGKFDDIVLGEQTIDKYINSPEKFYGATIGRYANRIANGKFALNGKEYILPTNDGPNSLHGGPDGFYNVLWDGKQLNDHAVELTYVSKDGEEGYPGNLTAKVIYTLTDDNELKITYEATTDQPTVVNLTHHSFFNLNGAGDSTINNHILMLNADAYTPVDSVLIPTGEIASVAGTPMDFRTPTAIGLRVNDSFPQLILGHGYDHNWVLNKKAADSLSLAAVIYSPKTGREMSILTTEPGIQFYGGNFLKGNKGKFGKTYPYRSAFCLETQHYPDSPNHSNFPSTTLKPGATYTQTCIYKFDIHKQ